MSIAGTYINFDKISLTNKLDIFGIKYTSELKLLKKFGNIGLWIEMFPKGYFQKPKMNNMDGEANPVSVTISSNIVNESIFLCNSNPYHLIASFVGTLENLASESKAKKEKTDRWYQDNKND